MQTLSQLLNEQFSMNEAKTVKVYAGFAINDSFGMANATGCTFCEIECPVTLAKVLNELKFNISTKARDTTKWTKLLKPAQNKAYHSWIEEYVPSRLMGDVITPGTSVSLIWFSSTGIPKR